MCHEHPSTTAEAAAELLLCVPLIVLFPWLKRLTFDIKPISAVGRDSLFFYLWHPLAFALWSASGVSGAPLLLLSICSILAVWRIVGRLPTLSAVLGVRPVALAGRAGALRLPGVASGETVV